MARRKFGRLPRRSAPTRAPYSEFHIFVEGEVTECCYLKQIRRLIRSNLIEIHVYGAQGAPKTLVEAASQKSYELKRARRQGPYEVWAVFDIDQHPRVSEAIVQANANNVGLCISDPCFELWLVFHFRDYDAPVDRRAIQRVLATHCSTYERSGKEFSLKSCGGFSAEQLDAVAKACARASAGKKRRDEEGGKRNPSTTCYRLVNRLCELGR